MMYVNRLSSRTMSFPKKNMWKYKKSVSAEIWENLNNDNWENDRFPNSAHGIWILDNHSPLWAIVWNDIPIHMYSYASAVLKLPCDVME